MRKSVSILTSIIFVFLLTFVVLYSNLFKKVEAESSNSPCWVLKTTVECKYKNETYRVKLYKDRDFVSKQTLFTCSPIYHSGNDVSYSLGLQNSQSNSLSETLGVSVSSEVKAFGNGVSASLGISSTISTEFSTEYMANHEVMQLDSSDNYGYWVVYGYNTYEHYKIEVEKRVTSYVEIFHYENRTYTKGFWIFKKTYTESVKVSDGVKEVYTYTPCENYSGDFLVRTSTDQIHLDYKWLGK